MGESRRQTKGFKVHISDHAEDYAKDLEGNWLKFPSFHWRTDDQPHDVERWCIYETRHRDSGLVAQSNAAAIAKYLEPFEEGDDPDVKDFSASHWAVGWTEGHAIRVRDAEGNITPAFLELTECLCALSDYPVLDDSDHSEREYAAACDAIEQRSNLAQDDPPEGWVGDVAHWLWNNDQREMENTDGSGAWPEDAAIAKALTELGIADGEECAGLL